MHLIQQVNVKRGNMVSVIGDTDEELIAQNNASVFYFFTF